MGRECRAAGERGPVGSAQDLHWVGTEVAFPRRSRHIFAFLAAGSPALICLLFQLPKGSNAFTRIAGKVGRGWRVRPIPAPKEMEGSWGTE